MPGDTEELKQLIYSIQQTYILTSVLTPEKRIITCNQRIDIPTIEPLPQMKAVVYSDKNSPANSIQGITVSSTPKSTACGLTFDNGSIVGISIR